MIATPKPTTKQNSTEDWHAPFLEMLPAIREVALKVFSGLDPDAREEAAAEVVAYAVVAFKALWDQGKPELAYPTVLAMYGAKRVKIGRKVGCKLNVRDVSSEYCQLQKGLTVERLDRYDKYEGAWIEAVVEDHHTPVVDQVWFRIDFPDWLSLFPDRDRRIAEALAAGSRTGEVAREFEVSAGRISQMRKRFAESWSVFHGEEEEAEEAVCVPA